VDNELLTMIYSLFWCISVCKFFIVCKTEVMHHWVAGVVFLMKGTF
jgi:hypothetical protein